MGSCRVPVTGCQLRGASYGVRASLRRSSTWCFGYPVSGCRLQGADCRLLVSGCGCGLGCKTQLWLFYTRGELIIFESMETKNKAPHLGRKIGRIREMLGVKQETLAEKLGISQQAVSKIEQSEQVEDTTLERVADALGVSGEAIKNFSEEAVIYNIQNNYEGSSLNMSPNYQQNTHCTFNPIDKWLEAMEENKKLYEALLTSEREKVAMLERMLGEKK
jgi:transcriptional regulator with XRE-family HTH domain